jgi:hypothetical protein
MKRICLLSIGALTPMLFLTVVFAQGPIAPTVGQDEGTASVLGPGGGLLLTAPIVAAVEPAEAEEADGESGRMFRPDALPDPHTGGVRLLRFNAPGAAAYRLYFEGVKLPQGVRMFLYLTIRSVLRPDADARNTAARNSVPDKHKFSHMISIGMFPINGILAASMVLVFAAAAFMLWRHSRHTERVDRFRRALSGSTLYYVLALLLSTGAGVSHAEVLKFYMAPPELGGNDGNNGSVVRPVATLMKVQDLIRARGLCNGAQTDAIEVHIRLGTYVGQEVDWTCFTGAPITFTSLNFSSARPVFEGGGAKCIQQSEDLPDCHHTWFSVQGEDGTLGRLNFRYIKVQNYQPGDDFPACRRQFPLRHVFLSHRQQLRPTWLPSRQAGKLRGPQRINVRGSF